MSQQYSKPSHKISDCVDSVSSVMGRMEIMDCYCGNHSVHCVIHVLVQPWFRQSNARTKNCVILVVDI